MENCVYCGKECDDKYLDGVNRRWHEHCAQYYLGQMSDDQYNFFNGCMTTALAGYVAPVPTN